MGKLLSKLIAKLFSFNTEKRVLMLGLDAAGKSTILYAMSLGEQVCTVPTVGFNVEKVLYQQLDLTIWDVGGQQKIRPLWRHYFEHTDALIFVIDSADVERLNEAKEELDYLLKQDELKNAAVLIFANKMDLPSAPHLDVLRKKLEITERKRPVFLMPSVATKAQGLTEGLQWLHDEIVK